MDQEDLDGLPAAPSIRGRRLPSRRLGAVFAVGALIALTLGGSAALGASSSPAERGPEPVAAGTAGVDPTAADAAFSKFAACMREHGIDFGEPAKIHASARIDGSLSVIEDGDLSSGMIVVTGPASGSAGGSVTVVSGASPASADLASADPAFEAANSACSPILEEAGISTAGSGTIVAIEGGSLLPAPEGLSKP